MTYFSRAQWGARPAKGGPGNLLITRVEGIALHWPGTSKPVRGEAAVKAALRGWQAYHMDGNGWSDIAYQEAFDQDGNVYELRGITTQSGANGNLDVNQRFGAFLLVLAPGEQPSPKMIAAVQSRVKAFRARFPRAKRIVGHGQIRPDGTACPGPAAQALINSGGFEPKEESVKPSRGKRIDEALRKMRGAKAIAKRKNQRYRVSVLQQSINWLRKLKAK